MNDLRADGRHINMHEVAEKQSWVHGDAYMEMMSEERPSPLGIINAEPIKISTVRGSRLFAVTKASPSG